MRKTIRLLPMMLLVCLLLSVMAMPALALEKAADTDNTTPEYAQILNDDEWQILVLTNRARFANGLDPLTAFASIQSVCDIREEELAEVYSHTRPNGETCFSLLDQTGIPYYTAGENIAQGTKYTKATRIFEAWMNSTGHRENILSSAFEHMGVGVGREGDVSCWVQYFFTALGEAYDASDSQRYTECRIVQPSDWRFLKPGMTIDEMGLYAILESPYCGTCYLPILSEYVTGYDPQKMGRQIVTVEVFGFEQTVTIDMPINGLAFVDGEWGYYRDSVLDASYCGIVQAPSGTWYYIREGRIAWGFTGIAQAPSGTWYYIREGRIAWSYTGIVQAPSGRWLYIRAGRVAWSYTGLAQATSGRWLYVRGGAVDWNFTGIVKAPSGSSVYVRKGAVDWSYCGTVMHIDGKRYVVKNGRVDLLHPVSNP